MDTDQVSPFLNKLQQIVLDNLNNEQFGVEDLAKAYGLSRSQLHKKLKKQLGKSVSQFIREVRLEEAKTFLEKEDVTASEVAFRVGFSSATYFNTCFKEYFGYPPGEVFLRTKIGYEKGDSRDVQGFGKKIFPQMQEYRRYLLITVGLLLPMVWLFFNFTEESDTEIKSSIAVLPFIDMSEEKNQEHFVDGISEEIIHKLTIYKDLKVIGRASSFFYKNSATRVEKIGQELKVSYLLQGSVRKSKNQFRITIQLLETSDGSQIWSDTFDREIEDVLYTQDEIASIVAQRLNTTMLNEDVRSKKVVPSAYELYLKSREAMLMGEEAPTKLADSLIRESLKIDSTYSPSWSQLAITTYHRTLFYNHYDREEGVLLGSKSALRSLSLDSANTRAYIFLALFKWKSKEAHAALELMEQVNKLSPSSSEVLYWNGIFAMRTNQLDKAKNYLLKATNIDPKESKAFYELAYVYWNFGELDKARLGLQRSYELGPQRMFEMFEMAKIYTNLGNYDKAREYLKMEINPCAQLALKFRLANATGDKKAHNLIDDFKNCPRNQYWNEYFPIPELYYYELAVMYATIGDADNAFIYLNKSYEHISNFTHWLFSQPEFRNIQSDSKWDELMKRLSKDFNYNFILKNKAVDNFDVPTT